MTTLPARQRDTVEHLARLAALRQIGPTPAVTTPARLARPGEVPAPATLLLKAAAPPWKARAFHALGPVPYTWDLRAAGHQLAASVSIRLRHPDGRAAVGVWVSDGVTSSVGAKPAKGCEGPRRPPVWGRAWAWWGGWTWQVCTCDARTGEHPAAPPAPLGALELRAHVADRADALELDLALPVAA